MYSELIGNYEKYRIKSLYGNKLTINSLSNSIRQFKNNISEIGQVLGQLFVPIMTKVMSIVNGVTIAVKRLLTSIAGLLGIKLNLGEDIKTDDVAESIGGISDSLDDATTSAENLKKATSTLGIDELNINSPQTDTSSSSSTGSSGGLDLTGDILSAMEEYENAWQEAYDNMVNEAEAFADRIEKALEPVKKIFEDIKIGDWFAVGEDTSNLVVSIFDFFAKSIDEVDWHEIGTKIGDFFAGINWLEVFWTTGKLMWEGLKGAFELAIGSFETAPLETAILGLLTLPALVGFGNKIISFIVTPLTNAWAVIEPILSTVVSMINPITLAIVALTVGLGIVYAKNEEVRESFANATQAIKDGFQPAVEFITDTLLPDLQAGWERLKEVLSPFTDFLNDTFVSIWQDMINPALTYIGETVLPEVTGAFENLWNEVLVPLGKFLADVLEPVIQIVSDVLSVLWKNIVVPLAKAIGNILGKAFEGLVSIFNETVVPIVNTVIKVFQFLWNNVFSPIVNFLWNNFKPAFENVFKVVKGLVDGLSKSFGGLIDFITGVFTLNWSKAWNGVKDIFKGVFNGLISIAEGVINQIINGINAFLSGFNGIVANVGAAIGLNISISAIPTISLPRFETGGFPQSYSLFMAGEHGTAEMLGTVGGKTAVVGGTEITGISNAVYSTSEEELRELREMNSLLRQLLAKDTSVNIGDKEIYKASVRGSKSYGRLLIT